MQIIVTGGAGSGKSEFAENLILGFGKMPRYYIATMKCFDEESKKRVARHRKMRENKHFETIEAQTHLEHVVLPERGAVLLECMSNLVANEMYEPDGVKTDVAAHILNGVHALQKQCEHLVIVTNEVASDGVCYDASTMDYIRTICTVNTALAKDADACYEVVYGIPVPVKVQPSAKQQYEIVTDGNKKSKKEKRNEAVYQQPDSGVFHV
jgi:adenosylcobinamide kinase/adenosylcobinamide-phosphate guanylyltransferase